MPRGALTRGGKLLNQHSEDLPPEAGAPTSIAEARLIAALMGATSGQAGMCRGGNSVRHRHALNRGQAGEL